MFRLITASIKDLSSEPKIIGVPPLFSEATRLLFFELDLVDLRVGTALGAPAAPAVGAAGFADLPEADFSSLFGDVLTFMVS